MVTAMRLTLIMLCLFLPVSAWAQGEQSAAEAAAETIGLSASIGPSATLDAYYDASAAADPTRWRALFTDNARFYGTDPSEDWAVDETFMAGIKESFATKGGWDFDVRDRRITLSPDGNTAWFAELSHFQNTDYTLRPTGVMVRDGNRWRIAQMVMGVPFPNGAYDTIRHGLQATSAGPEAERTAVAATLDALHQAASVGDGAAYFDLYTDDSVFFGTDKSERWSKEDFQAYAAPIFSEGRGWTYDLVERHVELAPFMNIAWFDEILTNASYGTARGTGVLVRHDGGWKVAQYHLTFPIPNEIAKEVTGMIAKAETAATTGDQ